MGPRALYSKAASQEDLPQTSVLFLYHHPRMVPTRHAFLLCSKLVSVDKTTKLIDGVTVSLTSRDKILVSVESEAMENMHS